MSIILNTTLRKSGLQVGLDQ